MSKRYIIIGLIFLIPKWVVGEGSPPISAGVYDLWKHPTSEQIYEWWKPEYREKPDEQMEVIKIGRIYLAGGEVAFAAEVAFPERGKKLPQRMSPDTTQASRS